MRVVTTVFLLLFLCHTSALAQSARSGGGAASAQLMQQLQQLAADRANLQDENARIKRELDQLRKEVSSSKDGRLVLEGRARAAEAAAVRSSSAEQSTRASLEQQTARLEELVAKFRETANTLRSTETDRDALESALNTSKSEWNTCAGHNLALFELNTEVLDRFGARGGFTRLLEIEPFTQLKRVELENLVDDYRHRANDHRVVPAKSQTDVLK